MLPHMNFALPAEERWNLRPPFMGGSGGGGGSGEGDLHSMNFPNTPGGPGGGAGGAFVPLDFNHQMSNSKQSGGPGKFSNMEGPLNFHHQQQHHHPGAAPDNSSDGGGAYPHEKLKIEWLSQKGGGVGGSEKFPLQNGVHAFLSQFHGESVSGVNEGSGVSDGSGVSGDRGVHATSEVLHGHRKAKKFRAVSQR